MNADLMVPDRLRKLEFRLGGKVQLCGYRGGPIAEEPTRLRSSATIGGVHQLVDQPAMNSDEQ